MNQRLPDTEIEFYPNGQKVQSYLKQTKESRPLKELYEQYQQKGQSDYFNYSSNDQYR
jgi:hypothetical protein